LTALPDEKILNARIWEGLGDAARVLSELLAPAGSAALAQFLKDLDGGSAAEPKSLVDAYSLLALLADSAEGVNKNLDGGENNRAKWWAEALVGQVRDALDELTLLAPWLSPTNGFHDPSEFPDFAVIPSLRELYAEESELARTFEGPGGGARFQRWSAL